MGSEHRDREQGGRAVLRVACGVCVNLNPECIVPPSAPSVARVTYSQLSHTNRDMTTNPHSRIPKQVSYK